MIILLSSIVAWLRKWGAWLVGLVLALAYLVLRRRSAPSPGPSPVEKKAEKEASEAEQRAVLTAETEKQAATEAHEIDLADEIEAERLKSVSIENSAEEVNLYLRETGESVKQGEKK